MAEEEQAAKAGGKRRYFKSTRELVKIALDEGMTQDEIARLCRTQQSVVSKWKNGKGRGTEDQLAPLLKRFGARLRRTVTRIYLVEDATPPPFEQSPAGVRMQRIADKFNACQARWQQHEKKQPKGRASEPDEGLRRDMISLYQMLGVPFYGTFSWSMLDSAFKTQGEVALAHPGTGQRLVQVEGAVVFRYTFYERQAIWYRRNFGVFRIPMARWVLQEQRQDRFLLIGQDRRRLFGLDRHLLLEEDKRLQSRIHEASMNRGGSPAPTERQIIHLAPSDLLESPDDAGRWISHIRGPWTAVQLLQFLNDYLAHLETRHTPHDEQVLPFLLRKTLIELGYPVPGLSILSSTDEPDSQP